MLPRISLGAGIGMDLIKKELEINGYAINIEFTEHQDDEKFRTFCLEISCPKHILLRKLKDEKSNNIKLLRKHAV